MLPTGRILSTRVNDLVVNHAAASPSLGVMVALSFSRNAGGTVRKRLLSSLMGDKVRFMARFARVFAA